MKEPKPLERKPYNDINYPVFSFRYLHKDYNIDKCDDNEKKSLLRQIVTLSNRAWEELKLIPKHGLGSEKISLNAIRTNLPSNLSVEVQHLLAFRFDGKKAFLGVREGFVFHVIFVDRNFTLYKH